MSLRSSRRRPWPYHLRIGSILGTPADRSGFMLLTNEQGLLVARKQQMLDQVVPSEQEYGSAPVYRERTWTGRPTGGYGERVQSSYGDHRYYWGMDVQVHGGLFGKGPRLHPTVASGSTGAVWQFIDAPNASGALVQFILSGTKVFRRVDDTDANQVLDRDFAPGQVPSAVVFQGGYAGATANLYVAANGPMWERTPSGTWTACTLPATFDVERLEVIAGELWAADCGRCVIRKVTADPKVAANWSGPIFVGDPSVRISQIKQNGNQLFIFKENGTIFSLNSDGSVNDLFPGLKSTPINFDNGFRVASWLNALWFTSGNSFYRMTADAQLEPTGPGKMLDNASPVRGILRNFCGWGGYRAYATLHNPETGTTYLVRYGNWEARATEAGTSWTMDDQWDGAEAHWGKVGSALAVSGASGQERLYIGFSDGTWDWLKLVQNPLAAGSGAEFTLGPSELIFPLHHAMFQADLKHWLGFSIFGPVIRVGDEATLYFRLMASAGAPPMDPTGDWLLLGEFTNNGQRIPAPSNLVGNALQLKIALSNENVLSTPVIEIVAIHERVVPAFKRDLSMSIDARGFSTRMDGAVARYEADKAHQVLMNVAASPGSWAMELPDETINEIAVFGYQERLLPMQAGGGRGWAVDVQATQFRILTIYGIIGRLRGTRIGDLRGYTIASLKAL